MHFFTSWFGHFLRRRHNLGLFRRSALPGMARGPGGKPIAPGTVPGQLTHALWRAACDDIPGTLVRLQSHEDGPSDAKAAERLQRVGPNEVDHEKPLPWWQHLWQCYRKPFNVFDLAGHRLLGLREHPGHRSDPCHGGALHVIRRDMGTEAAEVTERYFDARINSRSAAARREVAMRELVPGAPYLAVCR